MASKPQSKVPGILFASAFGAALGAVGGAFVAASLWGPDSRLVGGIIGGTVLGFHEGVYEGRHKKGDPRPLFAQLLPDFFFGAILGWLVGLIFQSPNLVIYGVILGSLRGLLGLRISKFVIGVAIGAGLGAAARIWFPGTSSVLLGALIWPLVRLIWGLFIPEEQPLTLLGEQVPPDEAKYVVPFEANSGFVGVDIIRDLARTSEGAFRRNPPGIGLIDDLDVLRGPTFVPDRVDSQIREFYEHTSRYSLTIVPDWDWRYKPLFWAFKRYLAKPIGQANLPFNTEETQQGIVSYIDTIDFTCDDIIDLRGWIRSYGGSQEAIYAGIYTTIRLDGAGFVSVGFPLPESSFTATLLPYNLREADFILKTRDTGLTFPGHYLTTTDKESGGLTVMKLPTLDEEIEVFVRDGGLFTDHRFYLGGLNFLTLHYTMARMHD